MILYLVAILLPCILLQATLITGSLSTVPEVEHETRIGAVLDLTSRPGKEAKVAIELGIQDLNIKTNKPWVLYLQNSLNKPVHAAIAAKHLIQEHKVNAIVGPHSCKEASTIAEVINDSKSDHHIQIFLSLATSLPQQPTHQWPFFIQAVPTRSTHMNAIAALLQSLDIRQVTLIYETSLSATVMSHLYQAFQKTGSELTRIVPLTLGSYSLHEELEVLKKQKLKVFVIHTSLELAVRLFQTAKQMEMITDGYLWIATNEITDLFHSISSTLINSLKGMVGVKSYFPENTNEFLHFKKRFRHKFRIDYPDEEQDEPGIFAVQGYNTVKLLEKHLTEKNIHNWKPITANAVEIVKMIGKGYNSVYWTKRSGFLESVDDIISGSTTHTNFVDNVGEDLYMVQPWFANKRHRRRNQETLSDKRMRVGMPCQSLFKKFVDCDLAMNNSNFPGFSIDVFKEMMKRMNLTNYDLYRFDGSYDILMEKIKEGEFDAIAGDLTITEKRLRYANHTQPYTESGMEMIVPIKSGSSNQGLLFLKPFETEMWWLIVIVTIYNGFVIWLIERCHDKSLQGSVFTQIGIILWLAFSYLFTLRGDKMHSNLSRMSVVVWLFVALVIIQSYTASLASMLTAQRLEPTITSVEMLRNKNATVGYCNGSFVHDYLTTVLRFPNDSVKIKSYRTIDQYAVALKTREIEAIFLEVPSAKLFLDQYCRSFVRTGETFKVGGFGFAFSKQFSSLIPDANQAIMNMSESGKLKDLEDKYLNSGKCLANESSPDGNESLNFHSFRVLFMLTVGTSTVALAVYIIMTINEFRMSIQEHTNFFDLMAFIKVWQLRRTMRRSSSVVSPVEIEINSM